MERVLTMDKQQYVSRTLAECRRMTEQIADAVNNAPRGNDISGAEMQVRGLMAELRHKTYQRALQMRIDSTESSFSPSAGPQRKTQRRQGTRPTKRLLSVNGRIERSRRRFFSQGQGSDSPLDRLVDETEATVSVGGAAVVLLGGNQCPQLRAGPGEPRAGRSNSDRRRAVPPAGGERRHSGAEGLARGAVGALDWSGSQRQVTTPQGNQTTRMYVSGDDVLVPTITQGEKDTTRRARVGEERPKMTPRHRPGLRPSAPP